MADAALLQDPTNPEAQVVKRALKEEQVQRADDTDAPGGDLRLINCAVDRDALSDFESETGSFLKMNVQSSQIGFALRLKMVSRRTQPYGS